MRGVKEGSWMLGRGERRGRGGGKGWLEGKISECNVNVRGEREREEGGLQLSLPLSFTRYGRG